MTQPEVFEAAFWEAFQTRQRQRVWKNRVTGEWDRHTIYEPVRTNITDQR